MGINIVKASTFKILFIIASVEEGVTLKHTARWVFSICKHAYSKSTAQDTEEQTPGGSPELFLIPSCVFLPTTACLTLKITFSVYRKPSYIILCERSYPMCTLWVRLGPTWDWDAPTWLPGDTSCFHRCVVFGCVIGRVYLSILQLMDTRLLSCFFTNIEAAFVTQVQRRSLLIVWTPAVFQNEHDFHKPLINSVLKQPQKWLSPCILVILLNN